MSTRPGRTLPVRTARICAALLGTALFAAVACDTTQPHAAAPADRAAQHGTPGALPGARQDITPRLNASTYVAHGTLLEQQGRYEQAAEQYRDALKLTPQLVAAHNRLGIVLNRLGRHAEATAEFRAALQIAPQTAYLHNNLGFSLYLENKYDEADAALAHALSIQPNFARAHMNRALLRARQARFDDVLTEFALAVPQHDAYYNLALVLSESQRYAEAAHALEQALQLKPDFAAARDQLREISRRAAAAEANVEPPLVAAGAHLLLGAPASLESGAEMAADATPVTPFPPAAATPATPFPPPGENPAAEVPDATPAALDESPAQELPDFGPFPPFADVPKPSDPLEPSSDFVSPPAPAPSDDCPPAPESIDDCPPAAEPAAELPVADETDDCPPAQPLPDPCPPASEPQV